MLHSRLLTAAAAVAVAGMLPIGRAAGTVAPGSAPTSLLAISCPTRLVCTAVGGDSVPQVFRTADGGQHWSAQSASGPVSRLVGIDCPTTEACLAYGPDTVEDGAWGHILRTTTAGAVWTVASATPFNSFNGTRSPLACAAVDRCFAVNDGPLHRTTDVGRRWLQLSARGWAGENVLSCPPGQACFVVGEPPWLGRWEFGSIVGFGARTRTIAPMPRITAAADSGPEALSCATSSWCAVTLLADQRQLLLTTADGGLHWVTRALPGDVNVFDPVCVGPDLCVLPGISSLAWVTRDGGATWSRAAPSVRPSHAPAAIGCSGRQCYLVGAGEVWVSGNDLRTWTKHTVP